VVEGGAEHGPGAPASARSKTPAGSARPDSRPPTTAIIGVGNALRRDDGVGLEVVRLLSARARAEGIAVYEQEGEPLGLLDVWEGADTVVLVDAVRTGAAPGTIHRADLSSAPLPARLRGASSTHALGIGEAVELARTLHRLPARIILVGIEGLRFDAGGGPSEEVQAAVGPAAEAVWEAARGPRSG
jgi:hydrogenase maturation protease